MVVGVLKEQAVGSLLGDFVTDLFNAGNWRGLAIMPNADSENSHSVFVRGKPFAFMSFELSQISGPVDDIHSHPVLRFSYHGVLDVRSVEVASGMRQVCVRVS